MGMDFENDGIVDSTAQNPIHQYTEPGQYTVSLTTTNAYGSNEGIKVNYILVSVTGYVDQATGNDTTGWGSVEHPWATIGHAIMTMEGSELDPVVS